MVEEDEAPVSVEPLSMMAVAPLGVPPATTAATPKDVHVECSALESERDDEANMTKFIDVIEGSAIPEHRHEALALIPQRSGSSSSSSDSSSSSSSESGDKEGEGGKTA